MPRLMYDSVNANAIPADAQMVAGYIDGDKYRWTAADWNRFPHATKVRIARRTTTDDGHVLDVESGIPTVWPPNAGIVSWVRMRRAAGVEPTIYCNQLNDWQTIRNIFRLTNMREPMWWVSRYNVNWVTMNPQQRFDYINNPTNIPLETIGKQFAHPPTAGGHYDLSIVADYWPGVDTQEMREMTPQELITALEQRLDDTDGDGVPDRNLWNSLLQLLWNTDTVEAEVSSVKQDLREMKELLAQLVGSGLRVVGEGQIVLRTEQGQ